MLTSGQREPLDEISLSQKRKPYQPEYLHGDFGSDGPIAQEGVWTLYNEFLRTDNPKAQDFFCQWKILFGEVCGYDVEKLSDKLKKLAEFYGVKGKPEPGPLLFALHTYYAFLLKLLAAEIASFYKPRMTRQVERLQNANTSAKLKRELEELERGGNFHTMGITHFLEDNVFAWYLSVWSEPIEKVVRQIVQKLDEYNPGTFSEEPLQSRDLLKKLYQQLFPKSVRHGLGEYYTPDWLADHVLNELGYKGDPEKRLLDPACGSGTFLVMAINRIRRWYDTNREKCVYGEGELLKKILSNVVGFDMNPLAVMAARTNYLVAIGDLIRHSDGIEVPVYLCDSLMPPATFVNNEYAPLKFPFLGACKFDFVAGNPPWINLENLPLDYRADVSPLWATYGLRHSRSGPQIGSTKRDICALFVYSSADHFLKTKGSLGFVLTQSLFKSKGAGDGFRSFSYTSENKKVYLVPRDVHDLSDFHIFEGAVNRTAVLIMEKGNEPLHYPVAYIKWRPVDSVDLPEDSTLKDIFKHTARENFKAIPSDPQRDTSPWLTVRADCLIAVQKARGKNNYRAHTGVYTGGLNGVYWLRQIDAAEGRTKLFENLGNVGKKHVDLITAAIEESLVYPLLRGRDIHRWQSKPSAHILLPYDKSTNSWIDERRMKKDFPNAFQFLMKFRDGLLGRKTAIVRQAMERGPFYSMVAVGEYTFAPWKVIYKRLSNTMQAAVIPGDQMPHEKLVLVPAKSKQEAHYVAALLNSVPAGLLLRGAAVRVQTIEYAPSDIAQIKVPLFSGEDPIHARLAELSEKIHSIKPSGDEPVIMKLESDINKLASELFGITIKELEVLKEALQAEDNLFAEENLNEEE